MKAAIYGEIIWDVYPNEKIIGGAPFNFSAHIAHLGDEAYLISGIGSDEMGGNAIEKMKYHGVKTDFIQKNGKKTGMCLVTLDENKIPSYNVLEDTAYDNMEYTKELENKLKDGKFDIFYMNTLIQRSAKSRNTLKNIVKNCGFKEIFCDLNIREGCYDKESIEFCLANSTIIKISDEEEHFIYDLSIVEDKKEDFPLEICRKFDNIKLIIYTLGKKGSKVYSKAENKIYYSGEPKAVKTVSTVGAGDCYGATFMHYYMKNASIDQCIKKATERSSIVVANKEAVPF